MSKGEAMSEDGVLGLLRLNAEVERLRRSALVAQ